MSRKRKGHKKSGKLNPEKVLALTALVLSILDKLLDMIERLTE